MNTVHIVVFDFMGAIALAATESCAPAVYADAESANARRDQLQAKRIGPGHYMVLEVQVL